MQPALACPGGGSSCGRACCGGFWGSAPPLDAPARGCRTPFHCICPRGAPCHPATLPSPPAASLKPRHGLLEGIYDTIGIVDSKELSLAFKSGRLAARAARVEGVSGDTLALDDGGKPLQVGAAAAAPAAAGIGAGSAAGGTASASAAASCHAVPSSHQQHHTGVAMQSL